MRPRVGDCITESIIESTTQTNLSEGKDFHLLEPRSLSELPDFQGPSFYVFFPRAAPGCWERLVSRWGRRLTEVEGAWLSLKIPPAKAGQERFTHEALWRGEGTGRWTEAGAPSLQRAPSWGRGSAASGLWAPSV